MDNNVISNSKLLCVTEDFSIYYNNGLIVFKNGSVEKKCRIADRIKSKGLIARLLRYEPRCAVLVDKNTCLISCNGTVLKYTISSNQVEVEHRYNRGMKNPLGFCVVDNKNTGKREVYYGEYIWNANKGPVAIYKRTDGKWEKIYEFASNMITHIHNIVFDERKERFYVLTGDEDEEAGIWIADKEFVSVKPLLLGKQSYRACVAYPTEDGLIYATDTPLEANYLFKAFISHDKVERIDVLYALPGPCIYGTKVGQMLLFATSVEPDSSLPTWRYRITRKLGAGIDGRYAHIIMTSESGAVINDYQEKKDWLPIWLFQFGNFMFPYNTTNDIYATTQALSCGHGCTVLIEGK